MNRLYVAVGALLVIVVLSFTSCSLYKGKVAASVKADMATEVVTQAVGRSKTQAVRDYQVQAKKAVALDSVRAAAKPLEDFNAQHQETGSASTPDPWLGVFNDAVRRTNRAIADSVDMP